MVLPGSRRPRCAQPGTSHLRGFDQSDDLTGTDVRKVNIDLAGSLGSGDGAADSVIVNGTDGDDRIKVTDDGDVKVSGLVPTVNVLHSEGANDRLDIETLAGTDTVKSRGLAAGTILLFVDGVLFQGKPK